jgi:hypothetical protein
VAAACALADACQPAGSLSPVLLCLALARRMKFNQKLLERLAFILN